MTSSAAPDPRRQPVRTAALVGLIGDARGGGRVFVDATASSVALPASIRRVVATDDRVGELLVALAAPVVGCAGPVDGVEPVGEPRAPDLEAVAALRPDVIVTGAVDGVHDVLGAGVVELLRRVAPVVAVDAGRPAAALADLRAMLGSGRTMQ